MKQIQLYLVACAFLLCFQLQAQHLNISPEKPAPGEKITLTYDPAGSPLENQENLTVIAYLFDSDRPTAHEVQMTAADGKFTGHLTTTPTTKGTALSIKSKDGKIADDRNNKGYKILNYDKSNGKPVAGAYMVKAAIYGSYNKLANIDRNGEKAFNLVKKEFSLYPQSKSNPKYFSYYGSLAKRLGNEEALAEATEKMNSIATDENADEKQLQLGYELANLLEDKESTKAFKDQILEKYPKGELAQNNLRSSFRGIRELDQKVEFLEIYRKDFGHTEQAAADINYFASSIASQYAKEEDWENFESYLNLISDPARKANSLNSVAWGMSGESVDAEAPNAEMGKKYSMQSLEILDHELATLSAKPDMYTLTQWKENLKNRYAMFADTYALCAYHTGDIEAALKYQQITCEQGKYEDAEMNDRYSVYYEKVNGGEKTEELLAHLISKGSASLAMKERHKKLFLANNTMESAYEKLVIELERAANEKMRQELKEKMINKDAPSFDLVNLKGERVSLESLKGKIVVVDFWATWCGPCKASFPGMQAAVNKYQDQDDVAFVFIDTWERVEDKEKNAADFIASKNYTFNVLMDNDNAVVTAYGVSGIPTKFIVDKKGKIRFKSVGGNSNIDELVQELDLMIEMAKGSEDGLTGAP